MSSLLNIGVRAMFASNASLTTTSHNIANANVAGYSRQEVVLQTTPGQATGAGYFGKGVDVANVRRAHNDFLSMQMIASRSLAMGDDARASRLDQLQKVFPPGTTGLGYAMGEFFRAMTDLSTNPADGSSRQVVLARAADAADQFAAAGAQIELLQKGVQQDMATQCQMVNTLATNIAELNRQIAAATGTGQEPNDLLDQREAALAQLADLMQFHTITADDGTLGVFVAGGSPLVLGVEANPVSVGPSDPDATMSALFIKVGGQTMRLADEAVTGGSLGGMLRFQNEDLVKSRNELGQMAAAFADGVNKAQALGLDLREPPGSGTPIFRYTATVAGAPAMRNARDANGTPLTQASTTLVDASLAVDSDYELTPNPAAPPDYSLKRLSDGLVRQVSSGDTVDGFTLNVTGNAMSAGERFILKPVSLAASSMGRALDDPQGIAAALPATGTMGVANTGTATIASLAMQGSPAFDNTLTTRITFTNNTGDYTLELLDASNSVVSSSTGTWVAGQPIAANGVSITLNGAPATGDTVKVETTRFPASNNGNALVMAGMAGNPLVGRRLDTLGNKVGGESVTDAYASAMASVGVRAQAAKTAAKISGGAAFQAESLVASASGVNLDEEASRLIQFQQSYQAAAKVLQVAQTIFDTMISLAR